MSVVSDDRRARLLRRMEQEPLPSPDDRRALRMTAKLSLAAVADFCEVTRQAVAAWERGEKEPRGENREAYLEALNLMRRAS